MGLKDSVTDREAAQLEQYGQVVEPNEKDIKLWCSRPSDRPAAHLLRLTGLFSVHYNNRDA